MAITYEEANRDIEKVLEHFETLGKGNDTDRAAQLVLQTISVLERRIGHPQIIKMLYIDNPKTQELLPKTVYDVAQEYVAGKIDENTAKARLREAEEQYEQVFRQNRIQPTESAAVFGENSS